jgi:hypothetical protein
MRHRHPSLMRRIRVLLAVVVAVVTLSLSKGPPSLAAGIASTPLLVTTRDVLLFVDGDRRQAASGGAVTGNYRLLGTMADGSVLVSYDDAAFSTVEAITPALEPRKLKSLPRSMASLVGPADDGFVVYDGSAQFVRRYDAHGSLLGSPAAVSGVRAMLGIGDATIVLGSGQLAVFDRRGSLRRQISVDGGAMATLPNGRFAVTDNRDRVVRIYTAALDPVATLRPANRQLGALVTGPDGALAVVTGTPSCSLTDVEVDVFTQLDNDAQPSARIRTNVDAAVGLGLSPDAIYVANAGCRGQNGSVAVFARNGTPLGTIVNVGSPTGVLPFPAARAPGR